MLQASLSRGDKSHVNSGARPACSINGRRTNAKRQPNPMLRVGYPATLSAELFAGFPQEVELVCLPAQLDHDVEIDVWIPDPYPTRAMRIAPHLRGVRLVLSLM